MFEGLHIGRSGLGAAQRALETAAHNVANVNTPGYTRQRVDQTPAYARPESRGVAGPGASGSGVVVTGVQRLRDRLLDLSYRDAAGESAAWHARADLLGRAEEVLGPLDRGVPQALDAYWNAWERLSLAPQDTSAREAVLSAGRNLGALVNNAARQLDGLEVDATQRTVDLTAEVNRLAEAVARMNSNIQSAQARGDFPNDLRDQRDLALDRLAALVGARSYEREDGTAVVTIGNVPIVDGNRFHAIETSSPPLLVRWAVDGRPAAVGGEIGAVLEFATVTIGSLTTELNDVAAELRDLVNAAHAAGLDLDGNPGGVFFVGSNAAEFGVDPALGHRGVAASASGAASDGNHALAMGALRDTATSSGSTVGQLVNAFAARLGLLAQDANQNRDATRAVLDGVERQRLATGAVSLDEELADMLRFQRAFEAAARVITVIDQMLDRLINGTGATR